MNKWDEVFAKNPKYTPLNEIFLINLLEEIKKVTGQLPKSVIDLGCGFGDSLIKFSKAGLKVLGVDFSTVAIERACQELKENNINNVEIILSDLDDLNIKNSADIFFCKLTYAFIKDKEKFLDKVKSLMTDNSVFVIITPVLHEGIKYLDEDKPGIAVNFEETGKLFNKMFSKVRIFDHNYFGDRGDTVTYLLSK